MNAEQRIWRTGDGELVEDGDARAAFLAYAPGDEVAASDEAAVKRLGGDHDQDEDGEDAAKARRPAANKSRRPAENKGA